MKFSGRSIFKILVVISTLFTTSACQTTGSQQETATALGMIIGGVAGALIGSSNGGAELGAVLGAAMGGVAGAIIGAKLDEIDRLAANAARTTALSVPTGDRVEWESEENISVRGFATPISAKTFSEGRECRTVRQVAYIKGEEIEETTQFCKIEGTGRWAPA